MTPDGTTDSQQENRADEQEMPYSIVLLFRTFMPLSKEDLQSAAERGWQKPFDGEHDPMYLVYVSGEHAFVKAGSHVIKVLSMSQPYLGDPEKVADQLPHSEQRSAWKNHRAWVALDFWNLELPMADAYEMLSRLSLQLLSDGCCGVFLPKEEVFMPNDGTAEEGLQLLLERSLF
jgi:hypothetical protein